MGGGGVTYVLVTKQLSRSTWYCFRLRSCTFSLLQSRYGVQASEIPM